MKDCEHTLVDWDDAHESGTCRQCQRPVLRDPRGYVFVSPIGQALHFFRFIISLGRKRSFP